MENKSIQEPVGDTVSNAWKIENREFCNMILLDYIKLYYILHGSYLKFIQISWCSKIEDGTDRFYEESYDTIKRILPKMIETLNKADDKLSTRILKNNIIRNLKSIDIDVPNNENN